MTTMTAGIDSNHRRSGQALRTFGRFALLIAPFLCLPQAVQAQFNPQQARTQSIIKPAYFTSLGFLQQGRYKQAIKGFQQASRNAIRFGTCL